MMRKSTCRFRNIQIVFDKIVIEGPRELGNDHSSPPVSEFKNCSKYDKVACAKYGCLLDPDAGLGGKLPF